MWGFSQMRFHLYYLCLCYRWHIVLFLDPYHVVLVSLSYFHPATMQFFKYKFRFEEVFDLWELNTKYGKMTQVRAVYEFEAQPNSGELSISVNEILTVVREVSFSMFCVAFKKKVFFRFCL